MFSFGEYLGFFHSFQTAPQQAIDAYQQKFVQALQSIMVGAVPTPPNPSPAHPPHVKLTSPQTATESTNTNQNKQELVNIPSGMSLNFFSVVLTASCIFG